MEIKMEQKSQALKKAREDRMVLMKLIEKLRQEVFSLHSDLDDTATKLPQSKEPEQRRKIETVRICDEKTGICSEKPIPEDIDVE